MKPEAGKLIAVAAGHLMMKTAPALEPGYEQSSVAGLAALLMAAGEELERGVARRVEENAAMRRLFRLGAQRLGRPDLYPRLEEASVSTDESLLISDLERSNAELRELLIEMHAHVETLDNDAARMLERLIWRELVASTERRRLGLESF